MKSKSPTPKKFRYCNTLRLTQAEIDAIHRAAQEANRTVANWLTSVAVNASGGKVRV
jgi:hypothetical protein